MKQTITIRSIGDLKQFKREFAHLVRVVRQADGKYVLYVDIDRGISVQPSIISKSDFDRVLSHAMHRPPAAFSPHIAQGYFLPERLDAAYGAVARETMKQREQYRGAHKILNRRDYIAYYYGALDFYPAPAQGLNMLDKKPSTKKTL